MILDLKLWPKTNNEQGNDSTIEIASSRCRGINMGTKL
jgi:hypothetical protein